MGGVFVAAASLGRSSGSVDEVGRSRGDTLEPAPVPALVDGGDARFPLAASVAVLARLAQATRKHQIFGQLI